MNNIKKFNKFKLKTFVIIIIVVTILVNIPASIIVNNAKKTIGDHFGTHAMNLAITVANFIEEDIEPYKELSSIDSYTKGNYDGAYYEKMLGLFQEIKKETGVDYIFTEKKLSNTEIAYILDGEDPASDNFSPIGSIDSMKTLELKVFTEGTPDKTDIVKDEKWGEFITGYAPIIDKASGEIVGVVGVDFSLSYIHKVMDLISRMALITILAIISILSIISYYLLAEYKRKLGTDYMTGLSNKRYYDKYLEEAIKHAQSRGHALSLIMIDVDNFKEINDRYGHLAGDLVIKTIAQAMKKSIRDIDICSRYAGDEFVVVLPGAGEPNAALIANRIKENVSILDFQNEGLDISGVTISAGIAVWKQDMTAYKLTEYADMAMYWSKNSGRNKVTVYNELEIN